MNEYTKRPKYLARDISKLYERICALRSFFFPLLFFSSALLLFVDIIIYNYRKRSRASFINGRAARAKGSGGVWITDRKVGKNFDDIMVRTHKNDNSVAYNLPQIHLPVRARFILGPSQSRWCRILLSLLIFFFLFLSFFFFFFPPYFSLYKMMYRETN